MKTNTNHIITDDHVLRRWRREQARRSRERQRDQGIADAYEPPRERSRFREWALIAVLGVGQLFALGIVLSSALLEGGR